MSFFAQNKVLVAISTVILVAIAWYMLSGSSTPTSSSLVTTQSTGTSGNQALVATLLQLRTVTLSGTIFSDPAFKSLHDFSKAIVPEPVGRLDPFAPLGAATSSAASAAARGAGGK